MTALTLTGCETEFLRQADALPAPPSKPSRPVIFRKLSRSSESRLKLTRRRPASRRARGLLWEEKAVGGHGEIRDAGDLRDAGDEVFDVCAQQGFAAGEPDFLDAQADGQAHDALDFLEREEVGLRHPLLDDRRRGWAGAPNGRDRNSAPPRFPAGNTGSESCSGR